MMHLATVSTYPVSHQHAVPYSQSRLEQLELKIRDHQGPDLHADWLNEYLDLGLELASASQDIRLKQLQEGWLRRVYNTLRDAALNPKASGSWRHQCLDYLYQPFFVLSQIYRQEPSRLYRLRTLKNEFATVSRLA